MHWGFKMFYDLHIHSALSPCGDDTMTIYNIFNMAYIKGLDLIAITDHNSLKQQYHLEKVIQSPILKGKIDFWYGVELQTSENIHVLAYFQRGTDLKPIQQWIDQHLIIQNNQPLYYGHQYIFDEFDEIEQEEPYLLLNSLDVSIVEVIQKIHSFDGVVVLAHVFAKKYSVYAFYHEIPKDLDFDGIEVRSLKEARELQKKYPHMQDIVVFINSDAHQLEDINEPVYDMQQDQYNRLWRRLSCKK